VYDICSCGKKMVGNKDRCGGCFQSATKSISKVKKTVLAPLSTNLALRAIVERENFEIVTQTAQTIAEFDGIVQQYRSVDTREAHRTISRFPTIARLVGLAGNRLQGVNQNLEADLEASLPRQEEALRNLEVLTAPVIRQPENPHCQLFGCETITEYRLGCGHTFCAEHILQYMSSINERNTGPDRDHPLVRQTCPLCRVPFSANDMQRITTPAVTPIGNQRTTSSVGAPRSPRVEDVTGQVCEVDACTREWTVSSFCGHNLCTTCAELAQAQARAENRDTTCPICNQPASHPPSPAATASIAPPAREQQAIEAPAAAPPRPPARQPPTNRALPPAATRLTLEAPPPAANSGAAPMEED
jgi:hypothetical protein